MQCQDWQQPEHLHIRTLPTVSPLVAVHHFPLENLGMAPAITLHICIYILIARNLEQKLLLQT